MEKNHGLNLQKELQDRKDTDWVFGAVAPISGLAEGIQFKKYLPMGEIQRGKEDTMDCATRSPENNAECKFTYLYQVGFFKGYLRKWLEDNGYVVNNRVVFSDAFNAIKSNTTKNGNSMIAPLDSMYRDGLIPKAMLPLEKWMTWADYHNKKRITPEMTALGKKFLELFTINYLRVPRKDFNKIIDRDMIDVAGFAWPEPINGEYPQTDGPFNHAFLYFEKPPYEIFDNYPESEGDYIKNLASDYNLYNDGYQVIVNIKTYEITTEMIRYAWLKRDDLKKVYPFSTKFVNVDNPQDNIYQWAQNYLPFEMPEIVIDKKMDWSAIDIEVYPEYKFIELVNTPQIKKNDNWFMLIWKFIKNFLTFWS